MHAFDGKRLYFSWRWPVLLAWTSGSGEGPEKQQEVSDDTTTSAPAAFSAFKNI